MTERPILFSAPMVRAILADQKTQTRRVVQGKAFEVTAVGSRIDLSRCPFGTVGDRLWVRETHWPTGAEGPDPVKVIYRADGEFPWAKWKPSIFMYREMSRIDLEVTEVRAERLQEIDPWDAWAEGIRFPRCECEVCAHSATMCTADAGVALEGFSDLWDSINGSRPGCAWADNPWVWAVSFRRVRP